MTRADSPESITDHISDIIAYNVTNAAVSPKVDKVIIQRDATEFFVVTKGGARYKITVEPA